MIDKKIEQYLNETVRPKYTAIVHKGGEKKLVFTAANKKPYPQGEMDEMFYKDNMARLNKINDILQDIEDDFDANAPDEWTSADVRIIMRDLTDIYNTVVRVRKVFKAKSE